jgi:hypothetical protein
MFLPQTRIVLIITETKRSLKRTWRNPNRDVRIHAVRSLIWRFGFPGPIVPLYVIAGASRTYKQQVVIAVTLCSIMYSVGVYLHTRPATTGSILLLYNKPTKQAKTGTAFQNNLDYDTRRLLQYLRNSKMHAGLIMITFASGFLFQPQLKHRACLFHTDSKMDSHPSSRPVVSRVLGIVPSKLGISWSCQRVYWAR